jgi:hypothetical protein
MFALIGRSLSEDHRGFKSDMNCDMNWLRPRSGHEPDPR